MFIKKRQGGNALGLPHLRTARWCSETRVGRFIF